MTQTSRYLSFSAFNVIPLPPGDSLRVRLTGNDACRGSP